MKKDKNQKQKNKIELVNKLFILAREIEDIVATIDAGLSYGGVGQVLEDTNSSLVDIAIDIKKTASKIREI